MLLLSLIFAAFLDYLIGDPVHWLHPVQVMGWLIQRYTQWALTRFAEPMQRRWAGVGLTVLLVVGSGGVVWAIAHLATSLHPLLGFGITTILLASCLAGRSLRDAANDVLQPLQAGDMEMARDRLSRYVGRDTAMLSAPEILRAVLETVTENAVDGVMAPLFYAVIGVGLSHSLGLATNWAAMLAIAYKAASTLDSMVGYRREPYTHLGWCSARLEDYLTWLPCRLTVLTLAILSGQPLQVLRLCQRDAPHDPSPNSGWSECAYAASLGVQLGGDNYYHGVVKPKPLLGDALRPITPVVIQQALALTRYCVFSWLGFVSSIGLAIILTQG